MKSLNRTSFLLLVLAIPFTTLAYGTVHQPTIVLFYLVVGSVLLFCAVESLVAGRIVISKSLLQLPLFTLAFYGVVQSIPFGEIAGSGEIAGIPKTISLDPFATRATVLHILFLGVFFSLFLIYLTSVKRIKRVAAIITVFGFVYAFYSILQSILSPDKIYGIYKPVSAIPYGTFVNKHNFAAFIEMSICIPLGLMFVGAVSRDKRLIYGVAIALMAVALLLSGSRGGLVAFISQVICLIVLTSGTEGRKGNLVKAGLSLFMAFIAIAGAAFIGGETSLKRIADGNSGVDISSSRFEIWDTTIKVIVEYFPFGTGLGAYPQAFSRFDQMSGLERVEQSHNDYLQVVSDAGVFGLFIGAMFLYWLFVQGQKSVQVRHLYRRGIALGALSGCVGILVHSLFDFVLHTTAISVLFLSLMTLLIASGRRFEGDDEAEERGSLERPAARVIEMSDVSVNR